MAALSLSGLEPDFGEGDNRDSILRAKRQLMNQEFKKNVERSYDENKIGKDVADFFSAQLPEGTKIDKTKNPTDFTAVNAAFSKDDPRKSLMPVVRDNYKALLRNKEFRGASDMQLLDTAYQATIKGTPSSSLPGQTYEDDIHRYKYKQDTALPGFGKNVAAAPGYDAWLANEKSKPKEDRSVGFGENMAMFAGTTAAFHVLKAPIANAAGSLAIKLGAEKAGEYLMSVAPPQGKLLGAVLTAAALSIPDTIVTNAVRDTDWYKAREDEPIKRELASMSAGLVTAAGVEKVGAKYGLGLLKDAAEKGAVSEAMLKNFFKDSTAENIMQVAAARRSEAVAKDGVNNLLNNVASDVEKKAWLDGLENREMLLKKQSDADALSGSIAKSYNDLGESLKLKSPVESGPFGWNGEANGPTNYGRVPGYTETAYFQKEKPFGWDGTEAPKTDFEVYPNGQAKNPSDQIALPQGYTQRALPHGDILALPKSGVFGPSGLFKDIKPVGAAVDVAPKIETTGGAGGGGIFGLKMDKVDNPLGLTKTEVTKAGVFGIPKSKVEKAFTALDTEDATHVMDQVVNRGKTIAEALAGMERTNAIKTAVKTSEDTISTLSERTKTLPTDQVLGYQGSQAAANNGKAGKVLALTQEVKDHATELVARDVAETKAIKSVAKSVSTLSDIVGQKEMQDIIPEKVSSSFGGNLLDGPLTDAEFEKRSSSILDFLGARFRSEGTAVPPMSKERQLAASKSFAKDATSSAVKKSEMAVADPEKLDPEFVDVFRGKSTMSSYVEKMVKDENFAGIESNRLYNLAEKMNIPPEDLPNTKIFKMFREAQDKAAYVRGDVIDPIVDDIVDFGGMKSPSSDITKGILKAMIPITAVGSISLAAVLGLPDNSEASVGSELGELAMRGIKSMPNAWINTINELKQAAGKTAAEIAEGSKSIIREADDAGFTARAVTTEKILPRRQVVPNFADLAKEIYGGTETAVKSAKGLPLGAERLMSPWGKGNVFYKTGANPAVHLAAMQNAITNNVNNVYAVLQNIMNDVTDGASHSAEVIKMFEPLAREYSGKVSAYGIVDTKIKQLTKALEVLDKAVNDTKLAPDVIEKLKAKQYVEMARLNKYSEVMRDSIGPAYNEFISKHAELTKEAAARFPSTRVFLAANDTNDFKFYPWLQGMLTSEEREAAVNIKGMMKSYEETSVANGLNVITDRPYMHYSWHPSWNESQAQAYADSLGFELPVTTVPHNQFHSRMSGAVPMVPDVFHSVQDYAPMAEKILGWKGFWNKGGEKGASWYSHMRSSTVQNNPVLRDMWNAIKDSALPTEQMMVDKWMDRYTSFEVLRLLGGSPSVAYKHFFKNIGTWSTFGIKESAGHVAEAATVAFRNKMTSPETAKYLEKIGINPENITKKFYDDAAKSYTSQAKRINILDDLELTAPTKLGWFDNAMQQINHKAGFMVNAVESFDRTHSFLASLDMASRRGLTARDASYGIYDTILKNNFLGGVLNPSWAKNPLVRATMLFQTTAFKIFERRAVNMMQTGRAVTDAFKSAKGMNWTWDKAMSELSAVKNFITRGEYEFKKSIITDALAGERDFMGQYAVRQSMREMLYAGLVLGGGTAIGHDYSHHVFHLPFIGTSQEGEPVVGLSPIARGIWDTAHGKKYNGEDSDFGIVGDFLNNWLRSQGAIPSMINKAINVSNNDIPDIYREEGALPKEFRYFWGIPSSKEK